MLSVSFVVVVVMNFFKGYLDHGATWAISCTEERKERRKGVTKSSRYKLAENVLVRSSLQVLLCFISRSQGYVGNGVFLAMHIV